MAGISRFKDIKAWQSARVLTKSIHGLCSNGSIRSHSSLRSQLCRASISTMANIAEGFARSTDKDFAHFLDIARGSAIEVQSLLYVARDLDFINEAAFSSNYRLANETVAMTTALANYLRSKPSR